MSVVVDANLVAALAIPLPYSGPATRQITSWRLGDVALSAPLLLEYELSTILRKAVASGLMASDMAGDALLHLLSVGIERIAPNPELHDAALFWADRLGQSKTNDAHYLALTEALGAELWTADRRLVNSVQQLGVSWVHWIGEA